MPARIVVVHDDREQLDRIADALKAAAYGVAAFQDSMTALTAIEAAQQVELLITRIVFPAGKPNGVSLALVAKGKRPALKVIFTALPEHAARAEGIGEFLPLPLSIADLLALVSRHLQPDPGERQSQISAPV